MNRLFVITVGSFEARGLISPGELPDVVFQFYSSAKERGAIPSYHAGGIFKAIKGDVILNLTIGPYHAAIPSSMLCELIEKAMDYAFT